jgi:hypothetical protein
MFSRKVFLLPVVVVFAAIIITTANAKSNDKGAGFEN